MGWRDTLNVPEAAAVASALTSVTDVAGMAVDKLLELLDEYGKAVALLEKFGFKVDEFSVSMGIPPEAKTSIEGSIVKLPENELKELIESHKDNKIVGLILNTLVLAKQVHQRVALPFDAICLHLTIALKPGIQWEFK